MNNPEEDIKKCYEYHKSKGISPAMLVVSEERRREITALANKLDIPVEVVTPRDFE